jgi:hypothetical protein
MFCIILNRKNQVQHSNAPIPWFKGLPLRILFSKGVVKGDNGTFILAD